MLKTRMRGPHKTPNFLIRCDSLTIIQHLSHNFVALVDQQPGATSSSSTMKSQTLDSREGTVLIRNAYPGLNPLDRYRTAIAAELARIEPSINTQSAFDGLDRTNNAAHGDLVLAMPRLRLKIPPAELAHKLAAEVCIDRAPPYSQQAPVLGR